LCERLVIRSKTLNETIEHILEFHFGEMRRKLEIARLDPSRPVISLSDLLSKYTYYRYEPSSNIDISFTLVQLEDLSDSHIHKLSNVKEMQDYILNNLPVRFIPEFKFADQIEKELRKNVPGYKSARIALKIENNPLVVVEKPSIPDVIEPRKGFIYDSKSKKLAYYWACLTSKNEAISSRGATAGFVYKQKGFTIGNREHLQIHFTRRQVYPWWTGEIYVISPLVIPTSARDDFEAGPPKDSLEAAVKDLLSGSKDSLQKLALEFQVTRRADEVLEQSEGRVIKIEEEITSGKFDDYQVYSSLNDIIETIKQHKNKATDRTKASTLLKRAESLQKRAKRELDQPTSTAAKQKKAIQSALDIEDNVASPQSTAEEQEGIKTGETNKPITIEQTTEEESLLEVIRKTGWEIHESDLPIVHQIDEAISDLLGKSSNPYHNLMEDIRSRLIDLMETK